MYFFLLHHTIVIYIKEKLHMNRMQANNKLCRWTFFEWQSQFS